MNWIATKLVIDSDLSQQLDRCFEPLRRRRFEPIERMRIAAPGDEIEHRRREVDAANLRLAMRTQNVARVP